MLGTSGEDYFIQRPHHNLFNKFFYSKFMKTYNPFHEPRTFVPLQHIRMAPWYNEAPATSWVDGIIDYTYNKENINSIGHFHMHENRKNKPNKVYNGGDRVPFKTSFITPTYVPVYLPKGCANEIKIYKDCVREKGQAQSCVDEKINIMEVCPKWALELLKERKRARMRATLIDNQTYRRAMEVADYNIGRSVSHLSQRKTWIDGTPDKLRSDAYNIVLIILVTGLMIDIIQLSIQELILTLILILAKNLSLKIC